MDVPIVFQPNQTIYFTGICGVGMTALALCLQDMGVKILGSDTGEEFVTSQVLRDRQIHMDQGFDATIINRSIDYLIYTGSHSGSNNPQVIEAKRLGIPVYSHAQALGILSKVKKTIAVCGVGGKTTTSAMLSTAFEQADKHPSYAIGVGGVSTLDAPGKWRDEESEFIVEADEYATAPGIDITPRFMWLKPETIVCTGIAHDHPDIYKTLAQVQKAFSDFFKKIPKQGKLIAHGDNIALQTVLAEIDSAQVITYGMKPQNEWSITSIAIKEQKQIVTIKNHRGETFKLKLRVPGEHNALNALAAYIVAILQGIPSDVIIKSLEDFSGTKRRFELIGESKGITFIDDYAHHPSEIQATLKAAKSWFGDRRIIAIFQPHTFSRTKALLSDFASCFEQADQVLITDIFASARESKDPSITSKDVVAHVNAVTHNATYTPLQLIPAKANQLLQAGDVVITLGAGDIYKIHESLSESGIIS